MLFLAIGSFLLQRNTYLGKLLIVFAICTLGYLIFQISDFEPGSIESFLFGRLGHAVIGVLWLIAYALFDEGKRPPLAAWVIIALYFSLRATGSLYFTFNPDTSTTGFFFILLYVVPQILTIGICVHTLALAILEYTRDLNQLRRNFRVIFLAILGSFWLMVAINGAIMLPTIMGIAAFIQPSFTLEPIINSLIFPALMAVNLVLFRLNAIDFKTKIDIFSNNNSAKHLSENTDPNDFKIKEELLKLMTVEKIYTHAGLSIGQLSGYMKIKEYKLRLIINNQLNFNNFSQFLNMYRIKEAENKLLHTDSSIFSIAVDVGYTSLSSFHKAFKDEHQITPKVYRILFRRSQIEAAKKEFLNKSKMEPS